MNTVLRNLKVSFAAIILAFASAFIFALVFPHSAQAVTLQKSQLNTNSNLRNGLVGYYTFDGADVTDKVYDRSGAGNNGGWYGTSGGTIRATSSARIAGKIGQTLLFDGTDDEVDFGSDFIGTSAATFSAWIYAKGYGGNSNGSIIENRKSILSIDNFNRITYASDAITPAFSALPAVSLNAWYFVTVTRTSGGITNIYVNGALSGTANQSSGTPAGGSTNVAIGNANGGGRAWDGLIDDVRVYNRVLSAAEIKQLYNLGQSVAQKSLESKNTGLKSGLVGYWPLDGADVTDKVYDRSGSGNNGGFYGGTTATTSARTVGKIGQALNFDGDDKVSLGDNSSLNPTDAITISAWINTPTPASFNMTIVDKEASGGPFQYVMRVDGTQILFRINGGTALNSPSSSIRPNTWYHVVGTYDRSFLRLYINGVTSGTPVAQATAMSDSGINLYIGSRGVANDLYFTGIIDDVRIYNRALSATEIKQLYSLGQTVAQKNLESQNTGLKSGLVGYWTFDGPDVTDKIYDRSGSGNNGGWYGTGSGTITSTTSARTYGKLGQALQFDGTDDYVDLGSTITSTFNSSFSVSLWYFHTSTTNQTVIGKRTSANSRIIVLNNSSTDIKTGQENVSFINTYTTPANWVGSWHHIIWTYNATTHDSVLYADGVLRDTQNYTFTNTFSGSTLLSDSLGLPFNGKMDDVRIYNRVLTSTEVQQLYNMGK